MVNELANAGRHIGYEDCIANRQDIAQLLKWKVALKGPVHLSHGVGAQIADF